MRRALGGGREAAGCSNDVKWRADRLPGSCRPATRKLADRLTHSEATGLSCLQKINITTLSLVLVKNGSHSQVHIVLLTISAIQYIV